jgi:hypothetical protein
MRSEQSPYRNDARTRNSLILGGVSLFLGFCCCAPLGIAGGLGATWMAWQSWSEARKKDERDDLALFGIILGALAILASLLAMILNAVLLAMNPGLEQEIFRLFGLDS